MLPRAPRLAAVQWMLILAFGVVIGRSAQVQLVRGEELRERAVASRTERVVLPARRGAILDRQGTPLALTLERFHVGVAPEEVRDRTKVVALLSSALRLSPPDVERRFRRRRWAYFRGPFSASQVASLRRVRGVYLESTLTRFYPSRGLVQGVVGRPARDGRPASGIERQLDSLLRGRAGEAVVLKDPMGRAYESPSRLVARPIPGMDVHLTLDAELQEIARQALREALRKTGATEGTVVALAPTTGDVLAALTLTDRGRQRAGMFTDPYEPGSIAKIFAAAALYSLGRVRDGETVSGEGGRWNLGFRVISDVEPRRWLTLEGAVKFSSNIGIAKYAARLSPEEQYLALRDFGFGTPTGLEVPTEAPGYLGRPDHWTKASSQSLAMGYEFTATPLQIATAYAALANDGLLMQPHLIGEIRTPDHAVMYRREPLVVRRAVSSAVATRLRGLLERAVDEGTGSEAALSRYTVGGKTGTARRVVNGRYQRGAYNATFIALFPAEEPQLVAVVALRDPQGKYHAGETAAPVARALIEQILSTNRGVIDRGRFALGTAVDAHDRPLAQGDATFIVRWPVPEKPAPAGWEHVVPDVGGATLRDAIRALHRRGFRVRVQGWGVVQRTVPEAGERAEAGTAVTLFAADR